MRDKRKAAVSIIGGAEGPTSVFIAGKTDKQSLKLSLRMKILILDHLGDRKRKRAEKNITAGTHSLEEMVRYAMDAYGAVEADKHLRSYEERRGYVKEALVLKYKPELVEEYTILAPREFNEDTVGEYIDRLQARSERIRQIPDSEVPMDFHIYEIRIGEHCLEIETDYVWNFFEISYSGNPKVMKRLRKISQELYCYYGVNEKDIREKTDRYLSLISALSM